MVYTSVVQLSTFRPNLWIHNRFHFILGKGGYISKKKNQSTIVVSYNFYFIFPSFTSYEYSNFQFLKHDRYVQWLCMQNFQIWLLRRLQANLPKQKQHKNNPKQSNFWGN
jgi:hypothetical protein